MKEFILLGLISLSWATIQVDLTKTCPCANFLQETNCPSTLCIWKNNSCQSRSCEQYTEFDCQSLGAVTCEWDNTCKTSVGGNCKNYYSEPPCSAQSKYQNCVYQDYTTGCQPFTKCSDYVPGRNGCSSKSGKYQACQNNAAGTACENASNDTVTCASYLTVQVCTTTYTGLCYWDFTSSTCQDLKSCTSLSDVQCSVRIGLCTKVDNSSCRNSVCSDYKTKDTCKQIYDFGYSTLTNTYAKAKLCQWSGSKCADATESDISAWTSTNCFLNSLYTYYWDGNKCTQCVSSGSNQLVFRIMVGLLMLII